MEGYAFAEVAVNSPIAQRRSFSYSIPDNLDVAVGQAVWAPFGEKTLQGVVLELTHHPAVEETREIAGIIDPVPVVSPVQIDLALWISRYYLAPLFECLSLMLPPGFERRVITFISRPAGMVEIPAVLPPEQREVLEVAWQKGQITQKELSRICGVRRTQKAIVQLAHQGLISRSYTLEKVRVKPRMVPYLHLTIGAEEARKAISGPLKKSGGQSALLRFLIENPRPQALSRVKHQTGCSGQTVKALKDKGLIEIVDTRLERDPLSSLDINLSFPFSLTPGQESAFNAICESLKKAEKKPAPPEVFLLYGVTGSGKTEIYLQALKEAVRRGQRGIVLVPEISMTPQMIERFVSRFPGRVAILHSGLSLGEQFDEWWRIKNGEFDVVIGPRSALFAPQPDLGLIVIDEEHEWTYKQGDSPRYHAREVALKLAELAGATVVLGSATPDVESYYRALNSEYQLLELPERVTPREGTALPQVKIVDLKAELKAGNLSLFSRSLFESIDKALKNGEQVLLFLNRRGAASIVECRTCGWVVRCKRCESPLSYHFEEEVLVCHQCNYHMPVPQACPRCQSRRIKYLGAGTERLEQEVRKAFPGARLLRWDSDIIEGRRHDHQEIFAKFRAREADILIGTQMIAKGLDLPGVTLVGAICADTGLNLPDFRAGERTFQLLSQVAGRAGRGPAGGRVIIQTYSPGHYAIQAAARHDYTGFYRKEIAYRSELRNPPFSHLARLIFAHTNDQRCQEEALRMQRFLLAEKEARGLPDMTLIGPAPAYIHRLRGRFRWQLVMRAKHPSTILSEIIFPKGWSVDIDPVGLA